MGDLRLRARMWVSTCRGIHRRGTELAGEALPSSRSMGLSQRHGVIWWKLLKTLTCGRFQGLVEEESSWSSADGGILNGR
jgi:hypothetical protein